MNVRDLEAVDLRWFGGDMDLTPCRPFDEDTAHFHDTCRRALAPHVDALYPLGGFQSGIARFMNSSNIGTVSAVLEGLKREPPSALRALANAAAAPRETPSPG